MSSVIFHRVALHPLHKELFYESRVLQRPVQKYHETFDAAILQPAFVELDSLAIHARNATRQLSPKTRRHSNADFPDEQEMFDPSLCEPHSQKR
jgi:hypothetical protein